MPAKGGVPVADYELDIQRYQDDHRKLLHGVTLVSAAGYRHCKASSTAIHTLTVKDGDDVACTFYLREHDLYLVGFKNHQGKKFAFLDPKAKVPFTGDAPFNMSCSYTSMSGKSDEINRKAVVAAIDAFHTHTGTDWNALSLPFLCMTLLVSESMRFHSVYNMMKRVVADRSGSTGTKFSAWESIVTAWNTTTTDLHGHAKLMLKPSQYDVKTWHHFNR